ncbi:MAG: HEAT repeat domain-containing protein [Candidatus Riflebacteria bacterium]|jgi:HEAT repeat protein|nr:HEAT repeat domain-containing protein [Candidatus Riflebacteria bacterium]
MIDKTVMIGMLETYDSFQTDIAVSVLRSLEESNSKVERKVIDFIKGKLFPVSVERISEYIAKMPAESIRDQIVDNLRTFHSTFMEMISFVGNESTRQTVYMPLIRMMDRETHPYRPLALATLCCFDFPEAVNKLAMGFENFTSEMRWISLVMLKKRWDEKFVPVFLKALNDSDSEVVRIAILALKRANVMSAYEPILRLLRSSSEVVVLTAVNALVELGAVEAMPEFKQLYQESPSPRVRATVVSAMGDLGREENLEFLQECLGAPDSRVRANAVIALKKKFESSGALPHETVEKIIALKSDTDHRVQADSIQALWAMGYTDNLAEVEKMLGSANEFSRSAGAYLCGKLKLFQLTRNLETLTADSSWMVRKMSAISLLAFGESGKSVLRNLMDFGSSDQQIVAAFAFGLADDSVAIEKLIAQSRSGTEVAEMATSLLLGLSRSPA